MRFAGTRVEGFLSNPSTDFGALGQAADTLRSNEIASYNDIQGKVAATGISAAAQAEAADITGAAAASAANSQANGSMFSSIGGIASSALGAFGGGGGTGGGSFSMSGGSSADWTSPSQPVFNSLGGIPTGYL